MRQRHKLNFQVIFAATIVAILAPSIIVEVLYIDSKKGDDANPGTLGSERGAGLFRK